MKMIKISTAILLLLAFSFVSFTLYQTQDDINANPDNIEGIINDFYNENRMAGFGVAVFSDKEVFYQKGFGYADLENKIPYTTQTTQYIASVSKTAIGVALMKAQSLGMLQLGDPINQYLPFQVSNPGFPNHEITIRQLATHTSSLAYNEVVVDDNYINEENQNPSLEKFMRAYFQNNALGEVTFNNHEPGSYWEYSNIGSALAAYIIELASQMTFDQFTQKHIFNPLKMRNTKWFSSEANNGQQSKYYDRQSDTTIMEIKTSGIQLYPARDMHTNVENLTKYCQAILAKSPALLSTKNYDEMLQAQLPHAMPGAEQDNNGIGWMIDRNNYGITYSLTGMDGGDTGIKTMMWFDPKTKMGFLFIGNTGPTKANRINHILIYQALVSLGDSILFNNSNNTFTKQISLNWHNVYHRITGLF